MATPLKVKFVDGMHEYSISIAVFRENITEIEKLSPCTAINNLSDGNLFTAHACTNRVPVQCRVCLAAYP